MPQRRLVCCLIATLFLILATHLIAAAQSSASQPDWETLRPAGEEFSVLMPKDSTAEFGEQPYHKMVLKTRLYLSATKTGPVLAVVSMTGIKSNPALYSEFQRLNSYVDAFRNWFPQKIRGKDAIARLTQVGNTTLNGHSGREYRIAIADLIGTALVYATKKRFYAVVVLNTKKDEQLRERFLSSFVLPEAVAESSATVAGPQSEKQEEGQTAITQPSKPPALAQKPDAPSSAGNVETKHGEAGDEKSPQPGQKRPINGGVLNGKAISLPMPEYPEEARSAGVSGMVVVQITVDENGAVIAARPVSGPPQLRKVCINAALQAKFEPTFLLGEPVKVTGVVTYNFVR